jgi:lysophospholipase L1-like esterase
MKFENPVIEAGPGSPESLSREPASDQPSSVRRHRQRALHMLAAVAVIVGMSLTGILHAGGRAEIPPGVERVLFLGDSITYSGEYVNYLETYFITRHPGRQTAFINAGLPSETVSGLSEENHAGGAFPRPDLHERLARVLQQTRPDLVFACYGINDGIYQPYDLERFGKFRDGIQWLRDEVTKTGAKIIFITPPTFDGKVTGNMAYVDALERHSAWLLDRRAAGWDVVDLHRPMNLYLAERRQREPEYAYNNKDGVHPDALGHWIMAKQVLLFLGGEDVAGTETAAEMAALTPNGEKILQLVGQRQAVMKDARLTVIGHQRPGMTKGLPLDEAKAKAGELDAPIRALAAGIPK